MSVLIKGMNMPKEGCKDCPLVKRGLVFDICPFLKREINGNVERGGKPYGCPLVELPTAQPEVIRCKDCKYYLDGSDGLKYCYKHDDDFCSKAERREECAK